MELAERAYGGVMSALLRLTGRSVAAGVVLIAVLLVAVQYYRVLRSDAALSQKLSSARDDIAHLRTLRARQLAEIRRLNDPRGAIPEIHDRLRLVGKNEALIYVERPPSPTPSLAP